MWRPYIRLYVIGGSDEEREIFVYDVGKVSPVQGAEHLVRMR